MLVASVRYCTLLDCEYHIYVDFSPLFVAYVRQARFPLNGITK